MESKSFYVAQDGLKVTILLPQPLVARILSMHHCVHLRIFVSLPPTMSDSLMMLISQGPIKTKRLCSVASGGSAIEVTRDDQQLGKPGTETAGSRF